MIILGIESSCDDTSVALLDCSDQGFFVLAEKTASQIEVHKKYGGVVPEVAGRQHAENIVPVIEAVFSELQTTDYRLRTKPDVIAVTAGPGLVTGLLVGVEAAKTLSHVWNIPLVAVNHIAGHAHSVEISDLNKQKDPTDQKKSEINYPALALIVSGGHTELLFMTDATTFKLIGKTRDDAAGEAFDKVGKLLGFDYPGGPKISEFAKLGNPRAIRFPRPMIEEDTPDFSFAGLKTAALYWLRDHTLNALHVNPIRLPAGIFGMAPEGPTIHDFCASFEQAIIDVLVTKTIAAAKKYQPKTIILGGGVSANNKLRQTLAAETKKNVPRSKLHAPGQQYAMDNGAMIAVAGYYLATNRDHTDWREIDVDPNWRVYDRKSFYS